jgi:hypothetical protein
MVGEGGVIVAAIFDGVPVGKLKFLFLIRLRGEFISLIVFRREKQVDRFAEFPRDVVFDLSVRAAWLVPRPLRRLRPVVKASQVDHRVAPADEAVEHLCQRAVGEREIALLDRENSQRQKRVFDLHAVTAQVGRGGRDEDLGMLGHASMLCNALGEGEQK